jgi:hypothetical protein
VRTGRWKQLIPLDSVGRGSWLRVFFADVTGDGALDSRTTLRTARDLERTEFDPVVVGRELHGTASLLREAHHHFQFKSFNIRTSSKIFASLFFSSVFSRSSPRRFFASETPTSPDGSRHRSQV